MKFNLIADYLSAPHLRSVIIQSLKLVTNKECEFREKDFFVELQVSISLNMMEPLSNNIQSQIEDKQNYSLDSWEVIHKSLQSYTILKEGEVDLLFSFFLFFSSCPPFFHCFTSLLLFSIFLDMRISRPVKSIQQPNLCAQDLIQRSWLYMG